MYLTVDNTVETKPIFSRALKTVMVPRFLLSIYFTSDFFSSCITRDGQRLGHAKTEKVVPVVCPTRMGIQVPVVLTIKLRPHDREGCQTP